MTTARSAVAKAGVVAAWSAAFAWQFNGGLNDLIFFLVAADRAEQQLTGFAWAVLVAGLALPVLGLVVGAVLGVRRTARGLALVLLAAFCASEALTLSVLALFQAGTGIS